MLKIHLFGGLDLTTPGSARIALASRSCRMLVGYLAVRPRRVVVRDRLAGTLWPDGSDRAAQKKLRNALWRLRCALPQGEDLVSIAGGRVGLDPSVWVDACAFEDLLTGVSPDPKARLSEHEVAVLEQAVTLYRGDLLDGFDQHWASGPRETMRLLHQHALERLVHHYQAAGDLRRAILRGRELVRRNPYLEHMHRELMLCHWALGDRPMAVRQYRACEQVLRRELDLEPMLETRELMERIRAGTALGAEAPHLNTEAV